MACCKRAVSLYAWALLGCCGCGLAPEVTKTSSLVPPGSFQSREPATKTAAAAASRETRRRQAANELETRRQAGELAAAEALMEQGEFDQARQIVERLLARDADSVDAQLLRAEILLDQGKTAESLDALTAVLTDNGENARAHYLAGLARDAQGDLPAALRSYAKAAELEPACEVYTLAYETALQPPQ